MENITNLNVDGTPKESESQNGEAGDDTIDSFVVLEYHQGNKKGNIVPVESFYEMKGIGKSIDEEFVEMDKANVKVANTASIQSYTNAKDEELFKMEDMEHLEELIKENDLLKSRIYQNDLNIQNQNEQIYALQNKLKALTEKLRSMETQDGKKNFKDLRLKNKKLEEEVGKFQRIKQLQDEELIKIKEVLREHEMKAEISNDDAFELRLNIAEKKQTELQKLLEVAEFTNLKLKDENNSLKAAEIKSREDATQNLESKRTEIEELNQKLADLEINRQRDKEVFNERFSEQNEQFKSLFKEMNADLANGYKNKKKQYRNTINELTKKVEAFEKKDNDEASALAKQIEKYKEDYEEGLRMKQSLEDERDKLMEQIGTLTVRNKKLSANIEVAIEYGYVLDQNKTSTKFLAQTAANRKYCCPNCELVFNNYITLESHITTECYIGLK